MALYKKVDLIEENQYDLWIQHIKIVLDQLKKPRHWICSRPVIYIYINGKPKHVKVMWSYIKKLTWLNKTNIYIYIIYIHIYILYIIYYIYIHILIYAMAPRNQRSVSAEPNQEELLWCWHAWHQSFVVVIKDAWWQFRYVGTYIPHLLVWLLLLWFIL